MAVLTAIASIVVLITNAGEMNLASTSVLYLLATFSLGMLGILALTPPVKKLQPIRVKR